MDQISSRWHSKKSRPSKKKQLAIIRAQKRWNKISEDVCSETSDKLTKSQKKLKFFSEEEIPVSTSSSHTFVSDDVWTTLLKELTCDHCGEKSLTVNKTTEYGYSAKLHVVCQACNENFGSTFSSTRMPDGKQFSVNKSMVEAFLSIGKGHSAMEKFSMALGLKPMDHKTFNKYFHQLAEETKSLKTTVLQKCREVIKKAYELNGDVADIDGVVNISVSYDGTWQKRGHSSLYGIGCVIDLLTGLVIDFELISKYCHMCEITKQELGDGSAEFLVWSEGHKSSGQCDKNFDGSANAMEMVAAGILWGRSVNECKMRYTVLLSDGDSKTFSHLCASNVYGGIKIEKEECINHIAKRLGTALRNKVKEHKIKGECLGGKKKGKLTDATINRLTNYYRKAIVDNAPDVMGMKTAIFSSLYHCSSTDIKPKHSKCPEGINSWCFFNRAKALGEQSQPHSKMKTAINEDIVAKILPVYQRLANDELLKRCTSGKTQNANESLHSVIWKECPKETFISKKRLEMAVVTAISRFNMGSTATACLKSSSSAVLIAKKIDKRRIRQSVRRNSDNYKIKAKNKKYKNKKSDKKLKNTEGLTYSAGAF